MTANTILTQYYQGLIFEDEALTKLAAIQVHGAYNDDGEYTGYDYRNQRWISGSRQLHYGM